MFSINSLISTRIIASSSPNIDSANALANSVLPTPVGPKKIKLPIGRLGSFNPARARRTALLIEVTASFWPITLSCNVCSRFNNRSDSVSLIFVSGIPVQPAMTSPISSLDREWIDHLELFSTHFWHLHIVFKFSLFIT